MDCATPSPEQFERELKLVHEMAYRYAVRLEGNQENAMDLLQESAISAFRSYHQFTAGTNFRAWFLRIQTNRFYARRKEQKRQETQPLADAEDLFLYDQAKRLGHRVDGDDPAKDVLESVGVDLIRKAIDSLPEEYRVPCSLNMLSDLSYAEIAEILELQQGTVRVRIHRGRKLLQKLLWQLGEERGLTPKEAQDEQV